MKLKYVIMYVESVAESTRFYEQAFGLETEFIVDGGDFGQMRTGETVLAFSSRALMQDLGKNPAHPDPQAPTFEIAFETDDVAGTLARALDHGASPVQDVKDEPWGQTTAYVTDLNGYLVEICTPVASQP